MLQVSGRQLLCIVSYDISNLRSHCACIRHLKNDHVTRGVPFGTQVITDGLLMLVPHHGL